jgi:MOSC domain-containing protein YiiM
MPSYRITSIQVGKPISLEYQGKETSSAIHKHPVEGAVRLSSLNFDGDIQEDLVNHGGKDKAVCAYAFDHYSYWKQALGMILTPGAFGENLTIEGLTEDTTNIGDQFQLGETLLEVSQPRQPCYKLAWKLNTPEMVQRVQETGYSGFYLRVLREGQVNTGDELQLTKRHPMQISIAYLNETLYHNKKNKEAILAILAVPELSENVRRTLTKRLSNLQ